MNVLLLSGSNRSGATSAKLLRYLAARMKHKGAEPVLFDLRERPLPIYGPEAEASDAGVRALVEAAHRADGIVLGTPEYHGSLSGVLKNALDYLGADQFSGKPVLSVSSSGGPVGVSSLTHMQAIVRNLHGVNSPEWISIGGDQRRFGPDGAPEIEAVRRRAEVAIDTFLGMVRAMRIGQQAVR